MMPGSLDTSESELRPGMLVVLGVPFDENSSFMRGAALAPSRIRAVLHAGSTNLCTEGGLDLSQDPRWQDVGDVTPGGTSTPFACIERAIADLLRKEARVLTLGGDHSITYPIVRSYAEAYPRLNLLQLDAHPDLYDEFGGNRHSHACTFARIMEEGLVARLVQVGIRSTTPHQREQAEAFGVEVIEMRDWRRRAPFALEGPVYVSLDLDALDPAYAPGVSHHEPGGFTARDVLGIIQELKAPIVGGDIVEFNPERDPTGVTATVAAKFLKEILGQMLQTHPAG
jgi:arginase